LSKILYWFSKNIQSGDNTWNTPPSQENSEKQGGGYLDEIFKNFLGTPLQEYPYDRQKNRRLRRAMKL